MPQSPRPKPPRHLRPATRRWWTSVEADYELEPHHLKLLTLAAEAWDRCEQARQVLEQEGLTYVNFHGDPRPRPEVAIERDSRIAYARMLRELALNIEPPVEARRPPVLRFQAPRRG